MAKFLHKRKIPKNVLLPENLIVNWKKLEKLKERKHKSIDVMFWQFILNSPLIVEIRQK